MPEEENKFVTDMELKAGRNGLIFWANPAGQVFFGKNIMGHKISDFIDIEYLNINFGRRIDIEEIIFDMLQGRKDFFQFRTKTQRYDGQFFLLHWQLRPIKFHEKWDGTGYPGGLKGNKIPLISRIIAIADAYCSLVEGRPYREPISHDDALEEIRKCSGTHFDPKLVKIFLDSF